MKIDQLKFRTHDSHEFDLKSKQQDVATFLAKNVLVRMHDLAGAQPSFTKSFRIWYQLKITMFIHNALKIDERIRASEIKEFLELFLLFWVFGFCLSRTFRSHFIYDTVDLVRLNFFYTIYCSVSQVIDHMMYKIFKKATLSTRSFMRRHYQHFFLDGPESDNRSAMVIASIFW